MIEGLASTTGYTKSQGQMEIFKDIETFKTTLRPYLEKNEAMNNLFIATLLSMQDATNCQFSLIDGDLAWLLKADHTLLLTEGTQRGVEVLLEHFSKHRLTVSRVRGPAQCAEVFVEKWQKLTNATVCSSMTQNIYQLDTISYQSKCSGSLRQAVLSEIPFLQKWLENYIEDAKLEPIDSQTYLAKLINEGHLFVWENQTLLSMAACSGLTYKGIRINLVYTPSELRGKGCATSCVVALVRHLLECGYQKCFLFADQTNLIANSIYKKIGFTMVGNSMDVKFG